MTKSGFAALLERLGAPVTANNLQKLYTWERAEGSPGSSTNNPFNTTYEGFGSSPGVAGISAYPSLSDGVDATAATLSEPAYEQILKNLVTDGSWLSFSQAVWASPWASGHYGYGADWPSAPVTADPMPAWSEAGSSTSARRSRRSKKKTTPANIDTSPLVKNNETQGGTKPIGGSSLGFLNLPGAVWSVAKSVGSLLDPVTGLFAPFVNFFKILAWLVSPLNWLRIFAGVAGALFAAGGVVALIGVF